MARGGGKSRGTGGKRQIPRKPGSAMARKRPKHSRFDGTAQKGNGAPGRMDFLTEQRLRSLLARRKVLAPDIQF